jgi:signal transduction histidine kinase
VILLAHGGLGYVPVLVAVSRFPYHRRTARVFVVVEMVLLAAAAGWAAGAPVAALTGLAVPVLVQRAAQRRKIIAQRDQARALLAEVQAGREAETRAAALRERGRVARELHDVLAHSLAGLSLQLQAVRAVAAREGAGPQLTEPIDHAGQLARDGLAEARRAVSTLHEPADLGVDDLPALVERHPGRAQLITSGEKPRTPLPAAAHAVYRAVQESLTNAARYAPGSAVAVTLLWAPHELRVRVEDDGPAAGHQPEARGTGLGLDGMAERITEAGGRVDAGARDDGPGWRVEISVPAVEPAAVPAATPEANP